MADCSHPALKEAENISTMDQGENSVRKLRRPKQASQEKKRVLKSTKKRYNKILGSWTAKTHAYVKLVSGGKMAPWSLAERKALLDALKKHSHQDWDALCRVLPGRSKEEIQKFIDYLRGSEVSKQKCTADAQLTWLPIESWQDMCQEMVHYEQSDLSTLISRVFSIIGNFSKFPEVTNPNVQPDYAKIYRYIAAVLDDSLSMPELSPLESAVLVDLTHGLGDQLRMSDTTLQRKVMCWKYKMLNHKFDFLDVKGSVERIRKALTNDFSDMQKQSQQPTEVVSPLRASTSQSGDADTNTSNTLEPSSSQQTGNEIPAAPQRKKRGRRPKDLQSDPFKYLEKPRLYSMNPFCVPIRLLKLKPLLAENGGLGRFSIHRQNFSSSFTDASVPDTRMTEETSSQPWDKDQDERIQKTTTIETEQDTIRELAGVCLKKDPPKRRRSAKASPRPPEASKNAAEKTRDSVRTVLASKVGGKVSSVSGAQATVTCEAAAGGDSSGSRTRATVTCEATAGGDSSGSRAQATVTRETIAGRDPAGSGAQTSVTYEVSPGTSNPSERQRAALPFVSVSGSAMATEEKEADEKQPEALKVVRAFRCVHSQDGQLLLVPIKLGPTAESRVLAPGVSQNTSQQQAKPLQIAARPMQPLQSAARFTKSLQSAARPIGSRKFQSSLTVSSSLFRSPLRAPIIGCSVSCGPDKSSGELQQLNRPYSTVVSRQPEAKRKASIPAAHISDCAKRPRTQSQESSRTLQDIPLASAPQSTDKGTDSEQEILSIEEMCKADRLKAKLLAAVYADQSPSKTKRHHKLDKDKTKTEQKKLPKTLPTQLPKRRRGRPPGSGHKQKLAGSGQQGKSKKTSRRPVVKGSTSRTFKQGDSATRPAAIATNTAAVTSDTHGSNRTCSSGSGTPVIRSERSETSKDLVAQASSNPQVMSYHKTAAAKTDGLVQARVVQSAAAGSQILPSPGGVIYKTGPIPENGTKKALKFTEVASPALGQKASLNITGTASPALRQTASLNSTGTASPALGQKASFNRTAAASLALGQKASLNSTGAASAALGQKALLISTETASPALGQKALLNSTGAVSPALGHKASLNSTGTASPALRQTASLNSTGTASPALGQKASFSRTAAASLALGQKASLNSNGAASPALGQKALFISTGTPSPALGQKALLNSTGAVSPALGQKASLNSTGTASPALRQNAILNCTGTASPALGQKASLNNTGTASPALGQKASLNNTGAVSPALGQTASFKITGKASPALGQKASFNSTGTASPTFGQKASRNSSGAASPALGQKASFKAILAQVASPHTASTRLSSSKTPSCSAAMKDWENCAVVAPAADVSGRHALPSSHFALSEQLPASKTPLLKKIRKPQEKSDFAKKQVVAPAACMSGTQASPPSTSVPSEELPDSVTPLAKKIKKTSEKSDFAKMYARAKPKVKRKMSRPRPIDSVDLSKAKVVYVSLDDARQRAFNSVQNHSDRPGGTTYKVQSEEVSLVSI